MTRQRKLFGTDGIRGLANSEPMTAETVLRIGMAAGQQFVRGDYRHRVVIGKDTRLSGYLLEPALTSGFVSVGMDVILVGPMPTPGVAVLTRSLRADLGVMISASHNLYQDNGIKLFGPDGYKLSDEEEQSIEVRIQDGTEGLATPEELGKVQRLDDATGRYIEFAKNTFPRGRALDGLKIVIDCANGAAYRVAPTVLWELGATVIPIGVQPDGRNINEDCGSQSPDLMQEEVVRHGADLGISFDGDADRLVMADEQGRLLDGDQLMALVATYWKRTGHLKGGGVVATVMSNLAFERYLSEQGLILVRTRVGDRYVVDHMRQHGFNVGGEQSGHIILSDMATTGDGLIAALQILAAMTGDGQPASIAGRLFEPLPQTLRNVPFRRNDLIHIGPLDHVKFKEVLRACEHRLGGKGRILVRESGTEPVIRVMAEGEDMVLVEDVVEDIVCVLKSVTS